MKQRVFIQTNNKQLLGARIAKYALESHLHSGSPITVEILNVDEMEIFRSFVGTPYTHAPGDERMFSLSDLQSFTLSRFMPPERMGYEGRAVVIDPDIFALTNIEELFAFELNGSAIAACPKKESWDTSVMLLDCAKLRHWDIQTILQNLQNRTLVYKNLMTLKDEEDVAPLPRTWNSLDSFNHETKMLHTTERLTQPWKTGLPIDFTRNKTKKILGVIPREPIMKLLGTYPTHYMPHPNTNIEALFFGLVKGAMEKGMVTREDITREIALGNVRTDFLAKIA